MRVLKPRSSRALILVLALAAGCSRPSLPVRSLSEANAKLVQLCREEYGLEVILKPLENTVWVYVPLKESFLEIKASNERVRPSPVPAENPAILFLDGEFKDGVFSVTYDIAPRRTYSEDLGYATAYSERYRTAQRKVVEAVFRAYGSVEQDGQGHSVERVPGDIDFEHPDKNAVHKKMVHAYVPTARVPEFFVVVIADIAKGLATKTTFYLKDLKRGMTDYSFYGEYSRRVIGENPFGNARLIGDETGANLTVQEVTWPDFLTQQILHRIRLSYHPERIPPEDTADEILAVTAQTLGAYGFEDFRSVRLRDLAADQTYLFDKSQLKTFKR